VGVWGVGGGGFFVVGGGGGLLVGLVGGGGGGWWGFGGVVFWCVRCRQLWLEEPVKNLANSGVKKAARIVLLLVGHGTAMTMEIPRKESKTGYDLPASRGKGKKSGNTSFGRGFSARGGKGQQEKWLFPH